MIAMAAPEPRWLVNLRVAPLGQWSLNQLVAHESGELDRLMAGHAQGVGIRGLDPTPAEVVALARADLRSRGIKVDLLEDGRYVVGTGR